MCIGNEILPSVPQITTERRSGPTRPPGRVPPLPLWGRAPLVAPLHPRPAHTAAVSQAGERRPPRPVRARSSTVNGCEPSEPTVANYPGRKRSSRAGK